MISVDDKEVENSVGHTIAENFGQAAGKKTVDPGEIINAKIDMAQI